MRYEEEIPGEWEVDERGRRYRELGKGCIEFEPTVSINGLEIPQSELAAYNAARRAAQERAAKNTAAAENAVHSRQKPKNCPFSSGCDTTCTGANAYLANFDTLTEVYNRAVKNPALVPHWDELTAELVEGF